VSSWDHTDLHLHSHHSDGQLSPRALMEFVASQGVRVAALTDHDTVAGLGEAQEAAAALGLHWIAGIELSCSWMGRTVHVLGFHFDPQSSAMTLAIHDRQRLRHERLQRILERLHRAGVSSSTTKPLTTLTVPTRTHIAHCLVAAGHAANPQQAFKRWLGAKGTAYVAVDWPSLTDTVGSIRAAGGIAVLAHPLRYTLSAGQRRQLLKEFQQAGGEGLEAVSGGLNPSQLETLRGLALRLGLKVSRGSDCHDPTLPWHQPSRLAKLHPSLTPLWD